MSSSILLACWTGKSAGLIALEDARSAELVQPPSFCVAAIQLAKVSQ
jgi:hypothetical protein